MRTSTSLLLLAALSVLCPASPAWALDPLRLVTQYGVAVWTAERGMPANGALALRQTRDGHLWVGTEEGLARFDGVRFQVFSTRNTPALGNNLITGFLFEDRRGVLWVGHSQGLSCLENGKWRQFGPESGFPPARAHAMAEDGAGVLWVGTRMGLWKKNGERFEEVAGPNDVFRRRIMALAVTRDSSLWAGTEEGLHRWKDGKVRSYRRSDGLGADLVRCLFVDKKHRVWAGTSGGGVSVLHGDEITTYSTRDGLSHDMVQSVFEDRDGNIWIGTRRGGLNRYQNGSFSALRRRDGLSDDFVYSVIEDREGNLWAGANQGLNRLSNGKFLTYRAPSGPDDTSEIQTVSVDPKGRVWASHANGLFRLEGNRFEGFDLGGFCAGEQIYSAAFDSRGTVWAGCYGGGVAGFRGSRRIVLTEADGLESNRVRALAVDPRGRLWVGTERGLSVIEDDRVVPVPGGLSARDAVRTIAVDARQKVWIGTNGGGLLCFSENGWEEYGAAQGLSTPQVLSLLPLKDKVWIGTEGGGLFRLKDRWITRYTMNDGLHSDLVLQILGDVDGYLWLASNQGISRVDEGDFHERDNGGPRKIEPLVFGVADGLLTAECVGGTSPTAARTDDGRLWFATNRGLAVIDPTEIAFNRVKPPVYIDEFVVDGVAAETLGAELPPGSEKFEIHFTAPSLTAPEKVHFRYRLEGLEKDWVEAGTRRVAYYNSLPPGRHAFHVIACNNDGLWNDEGARLEFYLRPRFYQAWWFSWFAGVAALAAGTAAYRIRVRHLRRRETELIALVDSRTKDLAEQKVRAEEANRAKSAFLANMSHELRTPLNVVLGFVQLMAKRPGRDAEDREHLELVSRSGEHLLGLINDILSLSKIESGQTETREAAFDLRQLLSGLGEMFRVRSEGKGLAFSTSIAEDVPATVTADEGKLRQILMNLLGNAVKFTREGSVRLLVRKDGDDTLFEVTDTGSGISESEQRQLFEAFYQASEGRRAREGTGLGLVISRNLARLMEGDVTVSSEPGRGSRFLLRVPLKGAPQAPAPRSSGEPRGGRVLRLAPGQVPRKVLVVDDSRESLLLLRRVLSDLGFPVLEAANGLEALQVIQGQTPGLVFMDIRMPVMDGEEAVRRLRQIEALEEGTAHTPVIAFSASAMEHEKEKILESGFDGFIAKPFEHGKLIAVLESLLGVEFISEEGPAEELSRPEREGETGLAALSGLPSEIRNGLWSALERGDDESALKVVDEIKRFDAALATAVARAVSRYEFDRLLRLLREPGAGARAGTGGGRK